jgi:hypothetical protein
MGVSQGSGVCLLLEWMMPLTQFQGFKAKTPPNFGVRLRTLPTKAPSQQDEKPPGAAQQSTFFRLYTTLLMKYSYELYIIIGRKTAVDNWICVENMLEVVLSFRRNQSLSLCTSLGSLDVESIPSVYVSRTFYAYASIPDSSSFFLSSGKKLA